VGYSYVFNPLAGAFDTVQDLQTVTAPDNAYIAPTGPVVFSDSFTEASSKLLNLHVPNVGTSWTLAQSSGGATYTVNNLGTLQPTSTVANVGCLYIANYASPSAAVEVGITAPTVVSSTNTVGLVFRYVDNNNFYLLTISSTAGNTILWKKVAGVWSNLALSINNISAGSSIKVRAVGSNIVVYVADIPVITRVDTSITAAGLCGISAGTIGQNVTDDVSSTWRLDSFYVQHYATAGGTNTNGINVNGDIATSGQFVGHGVNSRLVPAFTFAGDLDTGIYRSAPDNLSIVTGGQTRATFNTSSFSVSGPCYVSNGSAVAPTLSFGADSNTGFYNYTADTIGIATGGGLRWLIGYTGILSSPNASIIGTPDIATYGAVTNSGGGTAGFVVVNTNDYVETYFRSYDYQYGGGLYSQGKLFFQSGVDYTSTNASGIEFSITATNYDSTVGDFNVSFGAVGGTSGGNINLTGGASTYSGYGGNVTLTGGSSSDIQGGAVALIAGTGPSGGNVNLEGGYGQAAQGGTLYLVGGGSGNGPGYGGTVWISGGYTGSDYGPIAIQPNTNGIISVFGAGGSIQYNTSGGASSFVVGVGTPINSNSTFDGYTVAQVVKALRDYGWLA